MNTTQTILQELTERDLETLQEAVEAWEQSPYQLGILHAILKSVGEKDAYERDKIMREEKSDGENEMKNRKGLAVILKAKLEIARQNLQSRNIENA